MDETTPLCSALDPKQLFIYLKEAETEQQITQKDAILHALELEKEVKQETSRPRDNYPVTNQGENGLYLGWTGEA
ncbi:hypothetical protein F2Q69_00002953 [Brassica cretica]|uniref:Uncharacterized protein n=1 Tax=Brassica cretica TaxID=69181 RepID=A0A8S9NVI3_BRACR|nr:hypothetical protein F2Q69_00002953 [Brassica cretica]